MRFLTAASALALLALAGNAHAYDITVQSQQGPWVQNGTNTAYADGQNAAPDIIAVDPGEVLTLTYVGGTINWGNPTAYVSANGAPSVAYTNFPAPALQPFSLVGTFADAAGDTIGTPFEIGNGPTSVASLPTAQQLQLGVNDNYYADNTGSWTVDVQVPEPTTLSVLGLGAFAAGLLRRRSRGNASHA